MTLSTFDEKILNIVLRRCGIGKEQPSQQKCTDQTEGDGGNLNKWTISAERSGYKNSERCRENMREIQLKSSISDFTGLLKKIDKFKHFSDQDLNAIVDEGKFREYEANEVIIKDGDIESLVYLLIKGTLIIEKGDQQVGTLKRCGDMFGEMGVIDGSPRSATIRAQSKSLLLSFDASIIDKSITDGKVEFCYMLYRFFSEILAVRLRNTTEEVVTLKKKISNLEKSIQNLNHNRSVSNKNISYIASNLEVNTKNILILDKTQATRKIIKSIVKELKFNEVIETEKIDEATKIVNTGTIDIIISEWSLENLNGFDFFKKVRSGDVSKETPFILLLNESERSMIETYKLSDNPEMITRPFTANDIIEKIVSIFSHNA